jgi:hypothetical protein
VSPFDVPAPDIDAPATPDSGAFDVPAPDSGAAGADAVPSDEPSFLLGRTFGRAPVGTCADGHVAERMNDLAGVCACGKPKHRRSASHGLSCLHRRHASHFLCGVCILAGKGGRAGIVGVAGHSIGRVAVAKVGGPWDLRVHDGGDLIDTGAVRFARGIPILAGGISSTASRAECHAGSAWGQGESEGLGFKVCPPTLGPLGAIKNRRTKSGAH